MSTAPMTDQDLQDWAATVDAKSNVGGPAGQVSESVIAAGQALADTIGDRRGKP